MKNIRINLGQDRCIEFMKYDGVHMDENGKTVKSPPMYLAIAMQKSDDGKNNYGHHLGELHPEDFVLFLNGFEWFIVVTNEFYTFYSNLDEKVCIKFSRDEFSLLNRLPDEPRDKLNVLNNTTHELRLINSKGEVISSKILSDEEYEQMLPRAMNFPRPKTKDHPPQDF